MIFQIDSREILIKSVRPVAMGGAALAADPLVMPLAGRLVEGLNGYIF
jgi:hypothetical protein